MTGNTVVGSVAVGGAGEAGDGNAAALENGGGGGGGGGAGGGIDTHAGSRSSAASAGIPVCGGGRQNGTRPGERQTPPGAAAAAAVALLRVVDNAPIVSSLRASFRRAYVAVLAPPSLSAAAASATTVGNGNARAMVVARSKDPFLGASSLLLQVETRAQSPAAYRCVVGENGRGSGGVAEVRRPQGDETASARAAAAAAGFDRAGAGEEVMPAVCRWRGCVANALTG